MGLVCEMETHTHTQTQTRSRPGSVEEEASTLAIKEFSQPVALLFFKFRCDNKRAHKNEEEKLTLAHKKEQLFSPEKLVRRVISC